MRRSADALDGRADKRLDEMTTDAFDEVAHDADHEVVDESSNASRRRDGGLSDPSRVSRWQTMKNTTKRIRVRSSVHAGSLKALKDLIQ